MAESKKKPASKKAATKKAAPKKAAAKKTPTAPRAPKAGPRCIRNLLGVQQNLRLQGDRDKPYVITLRPRGNRGDAVWVPLACQEDTSFLSGLDRHFEVITKAEYDELQGQYPPIGYQGRTNLVPSSQDGSLAPVQVRVTRPTETVVHRSEDTAANAQTAEGGVVSKVGPNIITAPGGAFGGEAAMGSAPDGNADNKAILGELDTAANARRPTPKAN